MAAEERNTTATLGSTARAIYEHYHGKGSWRAASGVDRSSARQAARRAIAVLSKSQVQPLEIETDAPLKAVADASPSGTRTGVGKDIKGAEAATSTLFTCVKNECPYLLEWIAFHKVWGFDEIVVYDNESTDGTRELLEPLQRCGEIAYRLQENLPGVPPQHAAAIDAAAKCQNTWLAFLDADEFLVLHQDASVREFLSRFADPIISQVSVNWRVFGSGGQVKSALGLVIERFQMASKPDCPINAALKSITRPTRFQRPHVHVPFITGGLAVHPNLEPRWTKVHGRADRITHQIASVHHYVVKSREEFDAKIARGRGDFPAGHPQKERNDSVKFFARGDLNHLHEPAALGRIAEIREEIRRLEGIIGPAANTFRG